MEHEDDAFWAWAAPKLRRAYGYTAMTLEEIDAFLDTVEEEALPPSQIDAIVASLRKEQA